MKIIFTVTLNSLIILAPFFHAGGTGFWDEVISVVGSIVFIAILIHIFFFEDREDKSPSLKDKKRNDDDKYKNL